MESENDDFFSELCALRRQFGMSKDIPFNNNNNNKSPQKPSEYNVEEALVTEADLEASRRKLGEEYALTQQQIIRDIRDRLMGFAYSSFMFLDAIEWRESVSLLCQFYTLGH
ncbi:hypothetical protein EV177_009038, partial [Coemansia sp. RSA 1804]